MTSDESKDSSEFDEKAARLSAKEAYKKIPLEYVGNMTFNSFYENGYVKGAWDQFDQLKSELEKKDAEISKLQKRISWLESGDIHTCHDECQRTACKQRREIESKDARIRELEQQLALEKKAHDLSVANEEKYETALKFYADEKTYRIFQIAVHVDGKHAGILSDAHIDQGKRAREALKPAEEGK